jgi:FkbM family methyltransferase|tara:strand:- start:53 stop:787 length:735 start_codon:yes stop_codon:yes gene_type:complete
MKIKIILILSKIGFPISPILYFFKPNLKTRVKIMKNYNIDTILDIGANIGQYAIIMRGCKFNGKIISFEPLNKAYEKLKQNSKNDKKWIINNYAIGDSDENQIINIAGNSYSSSFLDMNETHLEAAPKSKYTGNQKTQIKKLDSIYTHFCNKKNNVMVKIDTQGFEKNVIDGAIKNLNNIKIIQLEMSIIELYKGEMLFQQMTQYLEDRGFVLISLENGFSNSTTGELLQVDGIFVNKAFANKK